MIKSADLVNGVFNVRPTFVLLWKIRLCAQRVLVGARAHNGHQYWQTAVKRERPKPTNTTLIKRKSSGNIAARLCSSRYQITSGPVRLWLTRTARFNVFMMKIVISKSVGLVLLTFYRNHNIALVIAMLIGDRVSNTEINENYTGSKFCGIHLTRDSANTFPTILRYAFIF